MKVDYKVIKSALNHLQRSGKVEFTKGGVVWISVAHSKIASVLAKGRTWT